jgi:hypothetical protein
MTDLLVGTRKGLFSFDRGPGGYDITNVDFLGVPVVSTCPDVRDGSTVVALGHGHFGVKVHRSEADGVFEEVGTPTYPPRPEDATDVNAMTQTPVNWSTEMVWTIEPGHADRPGSLWAGTLPGGLFRSDDRGDSWDLVRSLWDHPSRAEWFGGGYDTPGIHSISVDPRDSNSMLLAISSGGVWRSADDGDTWEVAHGLRNAYMPPEQAYNPYPQDPHRLARCMASPDIIWCQHHNGIFRSTDSGATFTEITGVEPSTFGFAVAAHPHDPLTAWFVPAVRDEQRIPVDGRMVVTRTRDGGQSFDVLGTGLPDRHAYHLVYRHALDVDSTGERLAMASTTGSLWISEDEGDSWVLVSSSLPPVACVRWAV